MNRIKTAIVGLGKIARDQHTPSIATSDAFELVAVASPHSTLEGVPCFKNIEALLQAVPEVSAIALCTTPQVRYEAARRALEQGCHVLLEKPPGARRTPIRVELDFRQTGPQSWDIEIDANDGRLSLAMGGSVMRINGRAVATPDSHEYPLLYAHFTTLVRARRIDVDLAPFQLVADALMCGRHLTVDPFEE